MNRIERVIILLIVYHDKVKEADVNPPLESTQLELKECIRFLSRYQYHDKVKDANVILGLKAFWNLLLYLKWISNVLISNGFGWKLIEIFYLIWKRFQMYLFEIALIESFWNLLFDLKRISNVLIWNGFGWKLFESFYLIWKGFQMTISSSFYWKLF